MTLPLHPPFLFLPSSRTYSPNSPLAFSSSPSYLPFFSYQLNRRSLFHERQCACPASSAPEGSLATVGSEEEEEDEEHEEKPTEPRRRLIAQNIPWTCTAEEIKTLFERHGTVFDVQLSMHDSSKNRGLAFITMASEEEAFSALGSLNSYDFNGRVIKVEFARSSKRNPHQETTASSPPSTATFNVFVGNLAWRVRSRDLRELFSTTGKLVSADVIYQSKPRRSAGYGFVSFATKEAEAAVAAHNEKGLMGRKIRLVIGKPQSDNSESKSVDVRQLSRLERIQFLEGSSSTLMPALVITGIFNFY